MKKLFVSCPMKGRSDEDIRKSIHRMHKMAEAAFDQELELIPSYIEDEPPENTKQAIWYLSRSIQLMSEADYFIGIEWEDEFNGCNIERDVASCYKIPKFVIKLNIAAPEYIQTRRVVHADDLFN